MVHKNSKWQRTCGKFKSDNGWYLCINWNWNLSFISNIEPQFEITVEASFNTGSGRVFSGSGIWPKYGAGFGKPKNILTGFGIWLLPRKRDSPKFGYGIRDFVACLSGIREIVTTQKTVIVAKANQPGERKIIYQSKGPIYILNLLAFAEMSLFNVFLGKKKRNSGKAMKKVRDAGFSWKRSGNAGSGPPLPDPVTTDTLLTWIFSGPMVFIVTGFDCSEHFSMITRLVTLFHISSDHQY